MPQDTAKNAWANSAAIPDVTDNSGGAVSSTIAAIAAGAGYTQADMVAVKNALASIAAKQNLILAAIRAAGQVSTT
jgi:hypothetical protein